MPRASLEFSLEEEIRTATLQYHFFFNPTIKLAVIFTCLEAFFQTQFFLLFCFTLRVKGDSYKTSTSLLNAALAASVLAGWKTKLEQQPSYIIFTTKI